MPTTQKQKIANQNNAQKSTGPRTSEGKQRASRNATKHGLHCRDTVINSPHLKESQTEFAALTCALLEELNPEGAFQTQLVHKIANTLWRQQRAIKAETAHLNREIESQAEFHTDLNPEQLEALATERSIPRGAFMLALLRYEMRLDIQLTRAYNLLRRLQSQKKTEILQDSYPKTPYMQNEPISQPETSSKPIFDCQSAPESVPHKPALFTDITQHRGAVLPNHPPSQ